MQQSLDELTLSCPATLGRSQVHWKVPHSSPPSDPPHSHAVCQEILPQQVNIYVYTEKCTLLYKRELQVLLRMYTEEQWLTLFLGTWLHLLPVMFPAASETPQQTPSDNEQKCTQSDTYSYTHTHIHTRMTDTVHTHTHITHSTKSYTYVRRLHEDAIPTKYVWVVGTQLTIATAAQNRRYKHRQSVLQKIQ